MFELFDKINNAYGTSTKSNNKFMNLVNKIKWDSVFNADGETYYCKGNLTLVTCGLDPFNMKYKPNCLFSDGSCIEVGKI